MIIYKNTINGFIKDCDEDLISSIIQFNLKHKRGLNVGASCKEIESWKTLKQISKILDYLPNKNNQYILLEFVIRDSFKRIDVMIFGKDENDIKNLAIIEMKGWSKIDLYGDTLLLNPNVSYGPCNHPSYEAYDYFFILTNMYSDVNDFKIYCYSYLPNYEYKNNNILKEKRFEHIISICETFCKNNNNEFLMLLKNHFSNCIDIKEIDKFDSLEYKPSKTFLEHMKDECNSIRLIGSQSVTYYKFVKLNDDFRKINKRVLFLISGSAGSSKTVVAFKMMTHLRSLGESSYLILPGPEFREAIKKSYNKKTSSNFIKGANSFIESDNIIVDEAHKATGRDSAHIFYERLFDKTRKSIISFIDNNQVINKKGITKDELKSIADKKNWAIVELNLLEQFRNGGDISYIDWLRKIIFNEDNNQEQFSNDFFDFNVLNHTEFNSKYKRMYENHNVRMVSFWTQTWDLNSLNPTVKIGECLYTWNPNWQWLSKYKENGNKSSLELERLCNKLNFNKDKKGEQYIGYFNTIQGYEFDYIFVHVPKLFYLKDNKIEVDISKLYMREMKSQIWSTKNILDENEKNKKEQLNKLYFLNRLFVNLTRGTKGTYVYFEDESLEKFFKSKILYNKRYS